MYRIERPDDTVVREQLPVLRKRIEDQVKFYHPSHGHRVISKVVNNSNLGLKVQVDKGSFTEWFLDWLLTGNNLEDLLVGDMDKLLSIVKTVEDERIARGIDNDEVYSRMTQGIYEKLYNSGKKLRRKVDTKKDHFRTVIYEIFVNQGYLGTTGKGNYKHNVFDKAKHVKGLNLRICPYCGRSFIYSVDVNSQTVKPQIDHFLPKSRYPYLALSYFNLIPVCQTCNMKDCKGEFDPMVNIGQRPFHIMYPYEYDDSKICFDIRVKSSRYYDDDFEVKIDYKGDADLAQSSREKMKLDAFYECHNHEVSDIYKQLMILKSRARLYYKRFKLPKCAFVPSPRLVLGFPIDDDSSQKEILYKLKKETYEKFR